MHPPSRIGFNHTLMNPDLQRLLPYPFERLAQLMSDCAPPAELAHINLSIGEPRHTSPAFVLAAIAAHLDRLSNYPSTAGIPELRQSIAGWLQRRFALPSVDADQQVLPVSGTREALFAFAQAVVNPRSGALVMSPNPFYQIYEGAALLAGATPHFINCTADSGLLPDFASVTGGQWRPCQLLYLCSPGNPTGAVMPTGAIAAAHSPGPGIRLHHRRRRVLLGDSTLTRTPRLRACCKPVPHWVTATFATAWYSTACQNAPTCPGCARALSPGDARILRSSLPCIAPITAVPCRCTTNWAASRPGTMRRMCGTIASFTGRSSPRCSSRRGAECARTRCRFLPVARSRSTMPNSRAALYASEMSPYCPAASWRGRLTAVNPGANHLRMALVPPLARLRRRSATHSYL